MLAVRDASRLARPGNVNEIRLKCKHFIRVSHPTFGMLRIPHVGGQRRFASCPPWERKRNSPEMQAFHLGFRLRSRGADFYMCFNAARSTASTSDASSSGTFRTAFIASVGLYPRAIRASAASSRAFFVSCCSAVLSSGDASAAT